MSDDKVHFGTVIWFNAKSGIGFILWELDGIPQKDMFVHHTDLDMDGFRTLQKDQKVSFEIGLNKHGQPKAVSVKVIK